MKDKFLKKIRKDHVLAIVYALVIMAGVVKINSGKYAPTFSMPTNKKIVLIDAGHGGWDPGKISEKDILEKDINLAIAEKLQILLEQGGAFAVTTRADDEALGDTKMEDLRARKKVAIDYKADILVSIHQNSYPSESVKGAQVFYFDNSENSKLLAEMIQKHITEFLDPKNKRVATSNSNYYMLKKTTVPAVIVECGFLSNNTESEKLNEEEYQQKVAWAIYMGIVDYFKEQIE